MSKIVILDEKTANQIAAGEVIERPASVVKEMVENSIDAGASQITVEIRNGGISYIRITDNGSGMEDDDVEIAFERHATSKIRKIEDLDGLSTMGFRGEALASIASVSHLEVTTKTREAANGIILKMEGGRVISASQTGCPAGTTFIIRNLFYNTPARYKFLKKDTTEAGYVSDIMERLAMAHPEISFKFIANNQVQMHTPGNNDLLSVIYSIYGREIAKSVLSLNYENEGYALSGYVGRPEISRGTRGRQSIFINGRYIKSPVVTNALEEAYKTLLMQNKFPFCVLLINTSPEAFDVNVHPQKLEVRFSNESALYSTIYHGVKNALLGTSLIRNFQTEETAEPAEKTKTGISDSSRNIKVVPSTEPEKMENTSGSGGLPKQSNLFESAYIRSEQQAAASGLDSKIRDSLSDFQISRQTYNTYEADMPKSVQEPQPVIEHEPQPVIEQEPQPEIEHEPLQESYVPVSKSESLRQLSEASIVGQAFDTYIILQNGDNLFIIDQHAAHERIRYETLKLRLSKEESFSQVVMEPFIIRLSMKEFNFVMHRLDSFQKLGFDVEAFGPCTVILRSIPDFYDSSFTTGDFQDILDRWLQSNIQDNGISEETIYMMSCKGAIKANRTLSKEEINGLVESLCTMENPYTCVHGRPVIITLNKKEFEKKFKRIV
jgi:DNA mismatch repair protein MutL